MIKCLITVNFALFPTRDFFQIILLYWKVLLPSLLYKLLLCALASCNRLWWAHFQMQYINHVDKPSFLSSSFFLLPQIFFSPSRCIVKPTCASQISAVTVPSFTWWVMSLPEQNYYLGWGVAGVPEADNLGIKQVNDSTFWTVENLVLDVCKECCLCNVILV